MMQAQDQQLSSLRLLESPPLQNLNQILVKSVHSNNRPKFQEITTMGESKLYFQIILKQMINSDLI